MRKQLLILSLILVTGCVENFKGEKEEPKKVKETVKETVKNVNIKDSIVNNTKNYTESHIENYTDNYTTKQLELKQYFDDYLSKLSSLDTEGIINMTYPKLFIPINENMFKRYINNILTSDQISIESYNTDIIDIGTVQPYENGEFANLKYKATITLGFINPNLYNDELTIRVLNDILSQKYGQENIQIDPTNRVITIKEEQKLLAIKDNSIDDGWKFIGDNPEYRKLYPKILPIGILSQF